MAKRKTRIMIEVAWDDEVDSHPFGWDIPTMIQGDPFHGPDAMLVRLVSFEDVDEDGRPEQV